MLCRHLIRWIVQMATSWRKIYATCDNMWSNLCPGIIRFADIIWDFNSGAHVMLRSAWRKELNCNNNPITRSSHHWCTPESAIMFKLSVAWNISKQSDCSHWTRPSSLNWTETRDKVTNIWYIFHYCVALLHSFPHCYPNSSGQHRQL